MGKVLEEFIRKYGEKKAKQLISAAGLHSLQLGSLAVADLKELKDFVNLGDEEKLVFALLESLDFQCYQYSDCPLNVGLSEEEIKQFLLKHRKDILKMKIPLPSALGALTGVFDFLAGEEQ